MRGLKETWFLTSILKWISFLQISTRILCDSFVGKDWHLFAILFWLWLELCPSKTILRYCSEVTLNWSPAFISVRNGLQFAETTLERDSEQRVSDFYYGRQLKVRVTSYVLYILMPCLSYCLLPSALIQANGYARVEQEPTMVEQEDQDGALPLRRCRHRSSHVHCHDFRIGFHRIPLSKSFGSVSSDSVVSNWSRESIHNRNLRL